MGCITKINILFDQYIIIGHGVQIWWLSAKSVGSYPIMFGHKIQFKVCSDNLKATLWNFFHKQTDNKNQTKADL